MKLAALLTATTGTTGTGVGGTLYMVGWILILGLVFYFMIYRPQKKQQKQQQALMSSLETGDSILTTSGFYGVVIDVMEEVIIVEFGNNKNCRIPMKKTAVVEIEKAQKEEA